MDFGTRHGGAVTAWVQLLCPAMAPVPSFPAEAIPLHVSAAPTVDLATITTTIAGGELTPVTVTLGARVTAYDRSPYDDPFWWRWGPSPWRHPGYHAYPGWYHPHFGFGDVVGDKHFAAGHRGPCIAARHGRATTVRIVLAHEGDGRVVLVRDDGTGFDPRSVAHRSAGYGMISMAERARSLPGTLEIDSAVGRGSEVRVRW